MGRGLGERQRQLLAQLSDEWTPLWELADDPDDPNEMAKARSAVRGLKRRGLVRTIRMGDPERIVHTTTVEAVVDFSAGPAVYEPVASGREWYGTWVKLR